MEQKRGLLCLALLVLLGTGSAAAATMPRIDPTPYAKRLGTASLPLSESELIQASLELSGASPGLVARDSAKLEQMIGEARHAVAGDHTAYAKGNALLVFMHKQFLTSYSETQARMDTLLRTGVFNCVSSAVLYMILGRAVGLHVEAVYTPDHAFCTVRAKGRRIDVETTNRYGFDPGTKTKFKTAFGETGFVYVPPGNYNLRTPTNGRGLLSFILQDRIAVLERQSRFGAAFALAVDRYAVLRTRKALADVANEANNYCVGLNEGRRYVPAIDFVRAVEKRYGRLPRLVNLMGGLVHNRVLALTNADHYGEALTFIQDSSSAGEIDRKAAANLTQMTVRSELAHDVRTLPFKKGLAKVQATYRRGAISRSQYRGFLANLFSAKAERSAGSEGYLAAVKVLDRGIALTGGSAQLKQGRRVYLNNYVATVHNHFASLFNAQDYARARKVLAAGLKAVPGSSMLNRDLALLRRTAGK